MLKTESEVSLYLEGAFDSRGTVLFAGAGVGRQVGLPDWKGYLDSVIAFAESKEPSIASSMRSRAAANRLTDAFDLFNLLLATPSEKYAALTDPLRVEPAKSAPLDPLLRLPFVGIATTNYDRSLLDSFARVHKKAPRTAGLADVPLRDCAFIRDEVYIARIHGKIEHPQSMVLSTADYTHLADDSSYMDFLHFIFTHRQCLFIGFSFMDPAINSILKTIGDKSMVGVEGHRALLGESASKELIATLTALDVRVELYAEADNHAALWNGIELARFAGKAPPTSKSEPLPYEKTRHLVALSYAATHLQAAEAPALSNLVLGGVLLSSMTSAGTTGADLLRSLRQVIPATERESLERSQELLAELKERKLADEVVRDGRSVWVPRPENFSEDPIQILMRSVENRLLVRELIELKVDERPLVGDLLAQIVLDRSWDLAQEFMSISGRPKTSREDGSLLEKIELASKKFVPKSSGERRSGLVRAIANLFAEPEPQEESVISDLVRAAFGVQVMTRAGRSALYSFALPQKLYLDSNILMPLVIIGHPSFNALNTSIDKLRSALTSVTLSVADVFLNEVVSHRRLALEEYDDLALKEADNRERYVDYYTPAGINAFISGYLNQLAKGELLPFEKWLDLIAPYTTEGELSSWLRSKGFVITSTVPDTTEAAHDLADLENELMDAYRQYEYTQKVIRPKRDLLKKHEARQLLRLRQDLRKSLRSLLVTDDRKLKDVVQLGLTPDVDEAVVSHLSLIQLIDLTVGVQAEPQVLNRIVWSVRMLDDKSYLRNYLVSRIQKHYDAAMLLTMPKMLDSVVERAAREARLEKVDIRPTRDMDKGRTSRFVNRIEAEFFSEMAREVRKTRDQLR